jgi:hypothetical protein
MGCLHHPPDGRALKYELSVILLIFQKIDDQLERGRVKPGNNETDLSRVDLNQKAQHSRDSRVYWAQKGC